MIELVDVFFGLGTFVAGVGVSRAIESAWAHSLSDVAGSFFVFGIGIALAVVTKNSR